MHIYKIGICVSYIIYKSRTAVRIYLKLSRDLAWKLARKNNSLISSKSIYLLLLRRHTALPVCYTFLILKLRQTQERPKTRSSYLYHRPPTTAHHRAGCRFINQSVSKHKPVGVQMRLCIQSSVPYIYIIFIKTVNCPMTRS